LTDGAFSTTLAASFMPKALSAKPAYKILKRPEMRVGDAEIEQFPKDNLRQYTRVWLSAHTAEVEKEDWHAP
jgi:hypothetical protein